MTEALSTLLDAPKVHKTRLKKGPNDPVFNNKDYYFT